MSRRRTIDPDHILDTVEIVIQEIGAQRFTLDAVAARAGVSKGGLVYNFGTKDDLIAAAMAREMARFNEAARRHEADQTPRGRQLAYAREVLLRTDGKSTRRAASLLTALIHAPGMLGPVHDYYRKLFEDFEPNTAPGKRIRLAILAIESVFWLRGAGLAEAPTEVWRDILHDAHDMIAEAIEAHDRQV